MNWTERLARVRAEAVRHATQLWWAHSLYALALGVGLMWLGSRHFTWLRVAGFHILAIWTCSLLLANYVDRADHTAVWWARLRLVINYVTKNFYQQILFFILPIYAASATWQSWNSLFVAVLGASAIVSTLDLVYDRQIAARRRLAGLFFAFNLFAVVNVTLPVLTGTSNLIASRAGTLGALLGYVTIARRPSDLARSRTWWSVAAGAVLLVVAVEVIRPLVPPAPLRLMTTEFGAAIDRRALRVVQPLDRQPAGGGRVYAVTALLAPMSLQDKVELRWFHGGRRLAVSAPYVIEGGRADGFRLWTSVPVPEGVAPAPLRLDVVTAGGQLIGRAALPPAR